MRILYSGVRLMAVILYFISCTNPTQTKPNRNSAVTGKISVNSSGLSTDQERHSLAGKLYLFGPEFDSINVQAMGNCDCCTADVLFLTDSSFLMIGYCESNSSFQKGKYRLDDKTLELSFEAKRVDKNFDYEKSGDSAKGSPDSYSYLTEPTLPVTHSYERRQYKGVTLFKGNKEFAVIDKEGNFDELLKTVKAEGIWNKLLEKP
jgi:hypothetical protein